MLPALEWEPLLANPAVDAAYRQVRKLCPDKALLLHRRSLVPNVPTPFWSASRTAIHVFIDEGAPTAPHSTVHELCHAILMGEGYHRLTGEALRCHRFVRDVLSNEFQHPEVYRRMREFGLDMTQCWERCRADLRRALASILSDREPHDAGFWYFPRLYPWFFMPHLAESVLAEYRAVNPGLCQAVETAYEETRGIGFETGGNYLQCLGVFKRHWLDYCEKTLLLDTVGQSKVWAVRESVTRPITEIVDSLSEVDLFARLLPPESGSEVEGHA